MGTASIAKAIAKAGAHYVLAVKTTQPRLAEGVRQWFATAQNVVGLRKITLNTARLEQRRQPQKVN